MAKVSQAHLDARRRQILDAARRCFVRDGFQAASVQDVLTEAGLSAGAVYRYFRSKEEIVVAIASEAIGEVSEAFTAAARSDPPLPLEAVLGGAFEALERLDAEHGIARLAVQVWGEAARSPALAERLAEAYGEIRAELAILIAGYQDRGLIAADVPPELVAKVLGGLLPGFILQRALLGDVDAEGFRAGARAILTTGRSIG